MLKVPKGKIKRSPKRPVHNHPGPVIDVKPTPTSDPVLAQERESHHAEPLPKKKPLSSSDPLYDLQLRELELLKLQLKLVEGLPHLHGFKWYKWAREFFESRHKENFLCAANQISKSSTQIRKAIHWATEPKIWHELWPSLKVGNQKPNQFWYFYPTFDVAQTEFETKWEPLFLPRGDFKQSEQYGWHAHFDKNQIRKIEFNSGVTIYFKAYAQKMKDLQTGTVYALYLDEECPVDLVPELQARLNATDGYMHMVFTATLGQLYWEQTIQPASKIDEKYPTAWKRQVSLYDCLTYEDGSPSHWDEDKIKRAIAKCPTQAEVDRRIFGKFVKSEGLRIQTFDYDKNTVDPHPLPRHWLNFSGIDPGSGGASGHPAGIVFVSVSPDYKQGRVWRAWRGDGIVTASPDILRKYRELRANLPMVAQKYDYASREFFLHGASKGEAFSPADKDRDAGWGLLNTLFKNEMLKIQRGDPELEKLISEIRSLPIKIDKGKAQDNLCDALRYCVQAIPWDYSDIDGTVVEDLSEMPKMKELTSSEQRREWFMGTKNQQNEVTVDEEIDFWNEMSGALD